MIQQMKQGLNCDGNVSGQTERHSKKVVKGRFLSNALRVPGQQGGFAAPLLEPGCTWDLRMSAEDSGSWK